MMRQALLALAFVGGCFGPERFPVAVPPPGDLPDDPGDDDYWTGSALLQTVDDDCDGQRWWFEVHTIGAVSEAALSIAGGEVTEHHTLASVDRAADGSWEHLERGLAIVDGGSETDVSTAWGCDAALTWMVALWDLQGADADCLVWGAAPDRFADYGCRVWE